MKGGVAFFALVSPALVPGPLCNRQPHIAVWSLRHEGKRFLWVNGATTCFSTAAFESNFISKSSRRLTDTLLPWEFLWHRFDCSSPMFVIWQCVSIPPATRPLCRKVYMRSSTCATIFVRACAQEDGIGTGESAELLSRKSWKVSHLSSTRLRTFSSRSTV